MNSYEYQDCILSSDLSANKIELVENGYLGSERRFNKSNLYEPQIPNTFTQTLPRVTQTPHTFTQTPPRFTQTPLEGSQRLTNNEYNYELNNEKNNEMNIISVPEIISISNTKVEYNARDLMKEYLQSQTQLEIEKAASMKEWTNS